MNGDALSRVAAAALATLTAFALTACGPDEAPSGSASSSASNATAHDAANSFAQAAAVIQPGPGAALTPHQEVSAGAAANIGMTASAASALPDSVADNPVASVVASLAADSQQVTPVIHAAPGDDSY